MDLSVLSRRSIIQNVNSNVQQISAKFVAANTGKEGLVTYSYLQFTKINQL